MVHTIRDARVDPQELENSLQRRERRVAKGRLRVREHSRAREARDLCRDDSAYLSRRYTAGDPLSELADMLDEWAEDFVASVRVRQDAAGGDPGFLAAFDDRRLLLAAIDLVFVATSLGRVDIAMTVLTHPAVVAVPGRALDALAVIHGVERPVSESEVLAGSYDPWLKVGNAAPEQRQGQFEDFVRGWRAHGEEARSLAVVNEFFTGAWAFEAVVLAQVFGLDDEPVREVPEYPVDLADYAREAGLPRLTAETRLPGPWQKPVPPKVLEPVNPREPLEVVGEPGLAHLAAVLSPVGGDQLAAGDGDVVLDAAFEAGAVLSVDARAMDPDEAGELVQMTCRDLGLPAPGRVPGRLPKDPAKALPKLDAWLETVGVRLLGPATDTDDLVFFPVLAADYETFAGHTIDGLRLRTMDQLATDEA
ncbi:PoNe immunity protein domain-containing protein [Ruania zhangjianzhongii]|uniref:PoNe immunity protein domain-containing protein n=1 Tax=Ruania zhangjianzhongii TaxID=2603206 RepID=UPI0011C9BE06|nr:PoNe immunity protein domain-containing protein [Ruania zhangjianzhongii]